MVIPFLEGAPHDSLGLSEGISGICPLLETEDPAAGEEIRAHPVRAAKQVISQPRHPPETLVSCALPACGISLTTRSSWSDGVQPSLGAELTM
jgi:hypothetical protein